MKKLIIILSVLFMSLNGFSQVTKEIDSFTNDTTIISEWETLQMSLGGSSYFRFLKSGDYFTFGLKVMLTSGNIFSVSDDAKLIFKTEDGTTITLYNLVYTITEKGAGAKGFSGSQAYGINLSYMVTPELEHILKSKITEIRFYTNDGYIDWKIKSTNSDKVSTSLKQVLEF